MKPLFSLSLLLAGLAAPLHAETPPEFIETLRARCAGVEGGVFTAPEEAVSSIADFNGDGITDPIIEEARFGCSTSATLFSGGSGGGGVQVFVSRPGGYDRFEFLAQGTMVVAPPGPPDRPVLLLSVHSGQCDVVAESCQAAYIWSETGRFVSIGGAVGPQKQTP
ncbi:hypothetical protein [Paenirhodobacter sp.]|uniref:hypothetical protein n=1 Tax=Paenirhodobacter sp. TaxID=1965326 RepID=UPI003B3DCAF1